MRKCIICEKENNEDGFVGNFCKKCFDSIKECCECGTSFDVNFKQDGKFYCEKCFLKKYGIEKRDASYHVFFCGGDYVGNSNDNSIREVLEDSYVDNFEYSEYGFDFEMFQEEYKAMSDENLNE